MKDRKIQDVHLGLGRAYCVAEDAFEEHIKCYTHSTAVGLLIRLEKLSCLI